MIAWLIITIVLLLSACYAKTRTIRDWSAGLFLMFVLGTVALSLNDHYNGPGTHPVESRN